jgi:hypothetical protein
VQNRTTAGRAGNHGLSFSEFPRLSPFSLVSQSYFPGSLSMICPPVVSMVSVGTMVRWPWFPGTALEQIRKFHVALGTGFPFPFPRGAIGRKWETRKFHEIGILTPEDPKIPSVTLRNGHFLCTRAIYGTKQLPLELRHICA